MQAFRKYTLLKVKGKAIKTLYYMQMDFETHWTTRVL